MGKNLLLASLFLATTLFATENNDTKKDIKISVDMLSGLSHADDGSKYSIEFKKAYDAFSKKDFKTAHDIWKNLCEEKKDARSCTNLGFMYDNALVGKTDKKKALSLYEKACDAKDPLGCKNLAIAYFKGDGFDDHDFKKAAEIFKKGCDLGDGFSCANLGYQYENGDGIEQNYEKAYHYYKKACEQESAMGCTNLGVLEITKNQDAKKAEELFKKGCNLGDKTGCDYHKKITSEEFKKAHG